MVTDIISSRTDLMPLDQAVVLVCLDEVTLAPPSESM
jgi:hypothetical protein